MCQPCHLRLHYYHLAETQSETTAASCPLTLVTAAHHGTHPSRAKLHSSLGSQHTSPCIEMRNGRVAFKSAIEHTAASTDRMVSKHPSFQDQRSRARAEPAASCVLLGRAYFTP